MLVYKAWRVVPEHSNAVPEIVCQVLGSPQIVHVRTGP